MNTWTNVSSANFTFSYGGSTTSTSHGSNDGTNIVTFGVLSSSSILAQNSYWYHTSSGNMADSDIRFNTTHSWGTSGSAGIYDVQNIGTHSYGHTLCLADLYSSADTEKTMYGYHAAGETKKRTLHSDDINGIAYLYPTGTGSNEDTMIVTAWNDTCGNIAASSPEIAIATRTGIGIHRDLFRFNLDNINPGVKIVTAKLRLYASYQSEYKDNYANVSRLIEAWEGNYATWCKRTASDFWSTLGGTWTTEGQATVLIPSKHGSNWVQATGPYKEWIEWNVTQIVKDWVENGQPNFGIIVHQTDIVNPSMNQQINFYTKEYSDPTLRPKLELEVGSDGNGGGGGCFIATAAYGSILEPHVKILREFRDRFMLVHRTGRFFVSAYYKHSPSVADFIAQNTSARAITRIALLPVVGISWVFLELGGFTISIIMILFTFGLIFIFRFRNRSKR
tara:strand:- start:486 stop:1832 length:1347 start_codon:yes stop_codon:yes gene_type:complete